MIEFEVGDQLFPLEVHQDSNPYNLAKQFVAKHSLDPKMTKQITALVMERLDQYNHKQQNEFLESKKQLHKSRLAEYSQNLPQWRHLDLARARHQEKPAFVFELYVGNKAGTVAVRRGDDPLKLAENYCNVMKVNREQYFGYVVAKI